MSINIAVVRISHAETRIKKVLFIGNWCKMEKNGKYKTCFVPLCVSTTIKTPGKMFFPVPQDEKVRSEWFKISKREDIPSIKSRFHCCEDHFNLKEDMDNYVRFCLMGAPIKLKNGIKPKKFDCQPNRVKTWIQSHRPALEKLTRKRDISEILANSDNQNPNSNEQGQTPEKRRRIQDSRKKSTFADSTNYNNLPSQSTKPALQDSFPVGMEAHQNLLEPDDCNRNKDFVKDYLHVEREPQQKLPECYDCNKTVDCKPDDSTSSSVHNFQPVSRDFGVQVQQKLVKPHVRSKYIMCKPENKSISVMCKPKVTEISVQCDLDSLVTDFSLIENKVKTQTSCSSNAASTILLSSSTNASSGYKLSSSLSENAISSGSTDDVKAKHKSMNKAAITVTRYFISVESKKYVGINNDMMWIVDLLQRVSGCSSDNILLTLMKIKTYDTFSRLGDRFGLSTSQASKIFRKTVKRIAHYLKTLVYCPDSKQIIENLPIAFRAHYSNVTIIVDAFEIEIEKPSDPVQQALTWSDYKKGNTLKYLIGCTPDGLVSFMSSGFGGRTSDIVLFEESKIMDIIPANSGVLVDRGFKQIQTILNKKKCRLMRPPSVSTSSKSSKTDVLKTKSVASLRIHVERVIRRVREYKMLAPHACLDWNSISYVDDAALIAASLINLQKPIIKK